MYIFIFTILCNVFAFIALTVNNVLEDNCDGVVCSPRLSHVTDVVALFATFSHLVLPPVQNGFQGQTIHIFIRRSKTNQTF